MTRARIFIVYILMSAERVYIDLRHSRAEAEKEAVVEEGAVAKEEADRKRMYRKVTVKSR